VSVLSSSHGLWDKIMRVLADPWLDAPIVQQSVGQLPWGHSLVTNFSERLPESGSDLANQSLKDPYLFDFLDVGKEAGERELQDADDVSGEPQV